MSRGRSSDARVCRAHMAARLMRGIIAEFLFHTYLLGTRDLQRSFYLQPSTHVLVVRMAGAGVWHWGGLNALLLRPLSLSPYVVLASCHSVTQVTLRRAST